MRTEIKQALDRSARPIRYTKREIELLWKPERPRKRSANYEKDLVNFSRKLDYYERIALIVIGERLALRRIRSRLQRKELKQFQRAARQGVIQCVGVDKNPHRHGNLVPVWRSCIYGRQA